jgi:hypothetical protein
MRVTISCVWLVDGRPAARMISRYRDLLWRWTSNVARYSAALSTSIRPSSHQTDDWVAYVSNESGRHEVLVRPFAPVSMDDGESVMVSKSGGTAPRWRADGKELFFVTPEGAIASVPVSVRPVLAVGSPTTLFQAPGIAADWGVSADGNRFLVMAPEVSTASTSFSLISDWQGTLDHQR